MTAYAILEDKEAHRLPVAERAEALTLVKDGFHWRAFWLSGLWLAGKGHWQALGLWLGALVGIAGLLRLAGFGPEAFVWLWLALALIVGFEAATLERDRLARKEAREIGYVSGATAADCEQAAIARLATHIERERQSIGSVDA
jgi:hypothetical protein